MVQFNQKMIEIAIRNMVSTLKSQSSYNLCLNLGGLKPESLMIQLWTPNPKFPNLRHIILLIAGVTGPVMVFDEALYRFTKNAEVDFLAVRVWVAIWAVIIALTVAAFQVSRLFLIVILLSFKTFQRQVQLINK